MSNVIELNHTFELYIPTQCICGQDLDKKLRDEAVLFAKNKFYDWFGGATVSPASGIWRLPDGTIADENVEILTSLAGDDSFDDYQDDAKKLAVTIADKLSQDRVLLKIDGKGFLFARSDENVKCGHNDKIKTAAPQKVIDATLDPVSVYYSLSRFASLRDARHLFCNVLNYTMASADLPWGSWKESVRQLLKEMPEVIADTNGFKIVHLHLTADTLKRGAERQVIQAIYQQDPTFRGLFVVSNLAQDSWELINVKSQADTSRSLTLRRMRVGTSAVRTATERIIKLHISEAEEKSITANEIQTRFDEAFDVTALTKQFFREISNWYFWAKGEVNFPPGQERAENEVVQATCVIRLITRLIFIWFLKEKRVDGHTLIPQMLFDKKNLAEILKGFDPEGNSKKQPSHYYKAILQNLFFATLNQPMKNRRWRKDGKDEDKNVYRYQALFAKPDDALALFKDIPFLNGGLFECLEQDQFSDLPDVALKVPDYLFFSPAREIDLNKLYGTKNKKYSVSGIIDILERYNFTVEENTPLEEEIALDPELLGKVFENLLASFNPETGETARKQTGSFYTPREIVNYMVDESLKAYLLQKLLDAPVSYISVTSNQADMFGNKVKKGQQELMEEHQGQRDDKAYNERLNKLLSYDDHDENPFAAEETELLINALHNLKVLDPACGSGAFPMGILHKMTHVLAKLDPGNKLWKERQLRSVDDPAMREHIERTFDANDMDFGRKLYLIQNSIYGVDIQPIAVQISKLRFFISLIVDQQIHKDQENLGILPLPNMETKFVAANTLIGLEKPEQLMLRDPAIEMKEKELISIRDRYFTASNQIAKQKCILEDERLRKEIGDLLKKDHWPATTANQIAAWNPYDTTKSSSFFDTEWMYGLMDGFDICIGNPPYIRVQGLQQTQPEFVPLYRQRYKSAQGSFDIYALFVEQGFSLLNASGQLVYILPHKFFQATFGEGLRKLLTKNKAVRQIVRFGAEQVFEEATTYTCLLFLSATQQAQFDLLEVKSLASGREVLEAARVRNSHLDYAYETHPAPEDTNWDFGIGASNKILRRLQQHPRKLGDIVRKIFQGIATSADKLYVLRIIEDNGTIIRCFSKYLEEEIEIESGLVKPFLMGKDVHRYAPVKAENVVIVPYNIYDDRATLMTQAEIKKNFPLGWQYLKRNEVALGERERGRMHGENFYAYIYPKNLIEFEAVKLMTPDICAGPQMTLDQSGELYHTTTLYSFVFKPDAGGSAKYFLGLLNSKVLWYFLSVTGTVLRGGYLRFKTEYLKPFPIPDSTAIQQKIIETLADYILHLKAMPTNLIASSSRHPLMVSYFEQLIDGVVYELYFPESFVDTATRPSELLSKQNLPTIDQMKNEKSETIKDLFEKIYAPDHAVRKGAFFLDTIEVVRVIEERAK